MIKKNAPSIMEEAFLFWFVAYRKPPSPRGVVHRTGGSCSSDSLSLPFGQTAQHKAPLRLAKLKFGASVASWREPYCLTRY